MIQREKIEELLKLPIEERRRVLRLLQESLPEEGEAVAPSTVANQTSPAAKWLLSMAGRYSGGPGNTAPRADEILRAEPGNCERDGAAGSEEGAAVEHDGGHLSLPDNKRVTIGI